MVWFGGNSILHFHQTIFSGHICKIEKSSELKCEDIAVQLHQQSVLLRWETLTDPFISLSSGLSFSVSISISLLPSLYFNITHHPSLSLSLTMSPFLSLFSLSLFLSFVPFLTPTQSNPTALTIDGDIVRTMIGFHSWTNWILQSPNRCMICMSFYLGKVWC